MSFTCNESAFDTLTEESEYWLGFLMADGCVSIDREGNRKRLLVQLKKEDESHLYKLKSFLCSEHRITNYRNECQLEIGNSKLVLSLLKYGIVPNKSPIAEAPDVLLESRHFWRGVVDGDGFVGFINSNKKNNTYRQQYTRLSLCGTENICRQFSEFAFPLTNFFPKVTRMGKKNCYQVHYCTKKAESVIMKLYKNSHVYLDRKYKFSEEVFQ